MTQKQTKQRREYQRNWWRKNKSKKIKPSNGKADSNGYLEIITAYNTLLTSTENGETKSQLNKVLSSIIIEKAK